MKPSTLLFITIWLMCSCHLTSSSSTATQAESLSPRSSATQRFLAHSVRKGSGCRVYPFICRLRGSSGPDCCKNSCVNVFTDPRNCGRCGKKCRHGETCCGGDCVDLSSNQDHCGRCYNKCKSGDSCSYGLCGYA